MIPPQPQVFQALSEWDLRGANGIQPPNGGPELPARKRLPSAARSTSYNAAYNNKRSFLAFWGVLIWQIYMLSSIQNQTKLVLNIKAPSYMVSLRIPSTQKITP